MARRSSRCSLSYQVLKSSSRPSTGLLNTMKWKVVLVSPPRARSSVHFGRLEAVPLEQLVSVGVGHRVDFVLGYALEESLRLRQRARPRAVGVGIVGFPEDLVESDVVAVLQAVVLVRHHAEP